MKLKSLTLAGFKSFARKTTFGFHDGVTCVVGPNGCGKSNIVDAIKWVLGEQSAKSLRGGEMMDVIFNGTPQRRSAGFAEAILTFADAAGILVRGSGEGAQPVVTIGRRLYRNGESEYLINNQVVRLKDVREMFMDTGVGVNAYSLIEQGKVETFLQASPADRRAVFDEAAGISRYKARKREAIHRLERVEQNLLRLNDILGEVQKRLRSIKYQAGKARRYQEHTTRLKQQRSLFSLAEYHRLHDERQALQSRCDELTDRAASLAAQIGRLETSRTGTETELAELEQNARSLDGRIATVSAQITTCQQRSEMLTARASELADAITSDASRCEQMEARIETQLEQIAEHGQRLAGLDRQLQELDQRNQALRGQHVEGSRTLQRLRAQLDDEKNGTIDLLRRTAQLHNEIQSYSLRRENLHTQRQRLAGRAEEIAQSLEDLLARRAGLETKLGEIESVLSESQARLDQTHHQDEQFEQTAQQLAGQLSQAQQDLSATLSRKAVLEEMQERFEGIGEGVRRLLNAARDGKFPFIRGMLGEFIDTDVARAHVIEAALAGADQRLVADRLSDVLGAAAELKELLSEADGVELMCLDQLPSQEVGADEPIPDGAIARASEWVRCRDALAPTVRGLLGSTLVVDSLERAFEIARTSGRRWRFVTFSGELLEKDGRVRIGSSRSAAGVIWRKSELADLDRRLQDAQRGIDQLSAQTRQLRSERTHLEEVTSSLRTVVYEANTERVEHRGSLERLDEQIAELRREAPLLNEEVGQLAKEIQSAVQAEHQARQRAAELEALQEQRESEIARLNEAVAGAYDRQEALTAEVTAAQVALAEAQQKQAAMKQTLQHVRTEHEALSVELTRLRERMDEARQRRQEAQAGAADARSQIQELLASKAALVREVEETAESRRSLVQRLEEIRTQLAADRKAHEELSEQVNEIRLKLGEVEVRVENLVSRTAEELGMDLPSAYPSYTHDQQRDWEAVRAEIAELRGKIERLGNVNLDAIAEQEELVAREKFLSEQTEDVRSSERQLSDLIRRINAESRRRFEQAYEAVRANFNDLFRKLFGGGKADILLTDPDDPLESSVEVVARPPGKELRSITLLSGGEKTMTALALLFSFFRARPSPFCVLDEVDAALDEANTQRFVQLVREFLSESQFIIISHAKRTIAMADQIYGVTMTQPGMSAQISVRFEQAAELAELAGESVPA